MDTGKGPTPDPTYAVSTFPHATATLPRLETPTWSELVRALTTHRERDTKDGPLFSPATFNGTRCNENVKSISLLVCDIDHSNVHEIAAAMKATGYAFLLHTTHNHSDVDQRCRVVFTLSRPVTPEQWGARMALAANSLGLPYDRHCTDPSRAFYGPSCAPGAPRYATWADGVPFDMPNVTEAPRTASREPLPLPRGAVLDTYVQRAIEAELRDLARTLPGHQNAQLNCVAFKLAALLAGAERLDLETYVTGAMIDIALGLPCSREPWTVRSAEAPIRSGWSAGLRHPRDLSHVGRDLAGGWL